MYARLLAGWFRKQSLRIPQDVRQPIIGIGGIGLGVQLLDIHDIEALGSHGVGEGGDLLLLDPGTEKRLMPVGND